MHIDQETGNHTRCAGKLECPALPIGPGIKFKFRLQINETEIDFTIEFEDTKGNQNPKIEEV